MNKRKFAVPPFKIAAAMLRRTTERLAREVTDPSGTAPDWSDLEWVVASAAAAMQGISAILAKRVEWSGPELWQRFLQTQLNQSLLRHSKAGDLLNTLDDELRNSGCSALALKGSAIRALQIYEPGERPMGDVDLLARPEDAESIATVIRRIDYDLSFSKRRHDVFEPRLKPGKLGFGEHVDHPLKIELHTRIAELLPINEVDISNRLTASEWRPGLEDYPSISSLLLHVVLHAAGNMRSHSARQIQFNDIAVLARRLNKTDWADFLATQDDGEQRWWVYPPLAMANRYSPGSIPGDILNEARSICPRALRLWVDRRSLTDISWSNIRIHAFPGISWARTPLEAAAFVRSRACPSRSALAELQKATGNRAEFQVIPWYGLTHRNRIIRWLISEPPRVQTMSSLSAAFENANSQGAD